MGLEIVASSEQTFSVTFIIFVARDLHIGVTQIRVRVGVGTGTISDINIMCVAKRWTVVIVSIDSMLIVFDVKLERLQSIFVFKGKKETMDGVCVVAARICNKIIICVTYKLKE